MSDYMNLEPMAIVSPNLGRGRSAGEDGQRFQALLVNLGEARRLKIRKRRFQVGESLCKIGLSETLYG